MAHAIVVGGSVSGLTAAVVLKERFERVTVVERDVLPDALEFRAGLPQGRQVHLFLRQGQLIVESLLPGFLDELVARGAVPVRAGREARWYHLGGWKQPNDCAFEVVYGSRLLVEAILRKRVRAIDGISLRDDTRVLGLITNDGKARGVRTDHGDIAADFVVDASGRESRAPEWLREAGLEPPREEVVRSHVGYASRMYRRKLDYRWKLVLSQATPPVSTRGGGVFPIEDGQWHALVASIGDDAPTNDPDAFTHYARTIPGLGDALDGAEPLGPVYVYRRTENRMRRFDEMPQHLDGFVAIGDAVCAFNPVYGQGMTIGAMSAQQLGESLKRGLSPRAFHKTLYKRLQAAWMMATNEDLRFATTEGGKRTAFNTMLQRYVDRVIHRTVRDPRAYDAFLQVVHMTRGPEALFDPRIMFPALLSRVRNDVETA